LAISETAVDEALPELRQIEDEQLRAQVRAVWCRLAAASAFDDLAALPVSPKLDYSHVTHNRSVAAMALAVASILTEFHGTEIDQGRLLAAALLQDASKLVEYEPDGNGGVRLSEIGERFPHAFYAAHVALEEGLPAELAEAILTHTYEAAGFPRTLEAKILFFIDQVDVAALGGDRWRKTGMIYR
jgi:hypothetical protein